MKKRMMSTTNPAWKTVIDALGIDGVVQELQITISVGKPVTVTTTFVPRGDAQNLADALSGCVDPAEISSDTVDLP